LLEIQAAFGVSYKRIPAFFLGTASNIAALF